MKEIEINAIESNPFMFFIGLVSTTLHFLKINSLAGNIESLTITGGIIAQTGIRADQALVVRLKTSQIILPTRLSLLLASVVISTSVGSAGVLVFRIGRRGARLPVPSGRNTIPGIVRVCRRRTRLRPIAASSGSRLRIAEFWIAGVFTFRIPRTTGGKCVLHV